MKTFEYRLRPTKQQEQALMQILIASRTMYNACLEELITYYQETGKHLHLYEQNKRHGSKEHPDLPAVVVDTTLKRLHRSFANFFRGCKEGRLVGFPRFKGANAWNTIQFRDSKNGLDNGYLKTPAICGGRIRTVVHRPLEGTFKFARVVLRPYRLIDLHSTNHTYVNGLNATSQLLKPRDEIRIGPFRFIYTETELTQFDESEGIRIEALLEALHLKKVGTNQTMLLDDISLHIPTRSFVALVGGSGAGKTTLLDALSGLRPTQEGSVFYNGQDYYHNSAAFSTQLGYVPQDDIIHRELTVERALYYAARLRLPGDFQEEQIEQRIEEVLDDVEMMHRRKLLINQLSGGQRKRVSIALELLAKPSVFFLDEPTSGLDPGLDRKMMLLLRKLADKGHTVLLVTHATNNINVCDYVCFLAQGGNLAYFGPPEETKAYFKTSDFAEIYSTLEPDDEKRTLPMEARERFSQSREYQKYIGNYLNPETLERPVSEQAGQAKVSRRGTMWRQFALLSMRYLELLRNDMGNLAILLLQAPIIGLLLLLFIKGVGVDGFNSANECNAPCYGCYSLGAGIPRCANAQ